MKKPSFTYCSNNYKFNTLCMFWAQVRPGSIKSLRFYHLSIPLMSHTWKKIPGPLHSLCNRKQHRPGNEASLQRPQTYRSLVQSSLVAGVRWEFQFWEPRCQQKLQFLADWQLSLAIDTQQNTMAIDIAVNGKLIYVSANLLIVDKSVNCMWLQFVLGQSLYTTLLYMY